MRFQTMSRVRVRWGVSATPRYDGVPYCIVPYCLPEGCDDCRQEKPKIRLVKHNGGYRVFYARARGRVRLHMLPNSQPHRLEWG